MEKKTEPTAIWMDDWPPIKNSVTVKWHVCIKEATISKPLKSVCNNVMQTKRNTIGDCSSENLGDEQLEEKYFS